MHPSDSSLLQPPIRVLRQAQIPLSDGDILSARIWLPMDSSTTPVPAVLEYIPYRKDDMTAKRDDTIHPVFAQSGYASIRVDTRGSGDSSGVMDDEYAPRELSDGLEVLTWIARQDWCDGGVGIIGKSWGGFNGLQIAALRPPELRAVITICSTDDRYRDDVHFHGGVIVGSEMLSWASTMLAYNARPQDPAVVGDGWRENWFERLNDSPIYSEIWLAHQRRDDYWKHASVCEDYSSIEVPVLAVGGLYDEYRGTLFTLLENLSSPTQSLLGPWAHNYPHQAVPGPAIDFLPEAVRWWDKWMKGTDNGVEDQPALRAFIPTGVRTGEDLTERPGRWIAEQSWPSPQILPTPFLADKAVVTGSPELVSTALIGATTGSWLQFGEAAGQAIDQREDDAKSFTASWSVGDDPVEFVGPVTVALTVASNQPRGLIAVRLCDVGPDGSSRLITTGLFNLAHHTGHEYPTALQTAEPIAVEVPLLASAHRFEPGHSIRVSVSASLWPFAWPSPTETTLTLQPEQLVLTLPIREDTNDEYVQAEFRTPTPPPPSPIKVAAEPMSRVITRDLVAGTQDIVIRSEADQIDETDGLRYYTWAEDRYLITEGSAGSAVAECRRVEHYQRPGIPGPGLPDGSAPSWDVKIVTFSRMFGDETDFFLENQVTAFECENEVFSRTWSARIPRDFN
nr:CocE/NonD family hydrolase [Glaciibacter superstes]